jgi:hypothetical protein
MSSDEKAAKIDHRYSCKLEPSKQILDTCCQPYSPIVDERDRCDKSDRYARDTTPFPAAEIGRKSRTYVAKPVARSAMLAGITTRNNAQPERNTIVFSQKDILASSSWEHRSELGIGQSSKIRKRPVNDRHQENSSG